MNIIRIAARVPRPPTGVGGIPATPPYQPLLRLFRSQTGNTAWQPEQHRCRTAGRAAFPAVVFQYPPLPLQPHPEQGTGRNPAFSVQLRWVISQNNADKAYKVNIHKGKVVETALESEPI